MSKPKVLAIHLPQFHPFAQNDEWWGKGFTEWTNVVSSKRLFKGHHQPQLPSDLGLYDLRNPQTQADQANLAKAYGIDGFCYYHYWFSGTRLMREPIDRILASKQPDFPFCFFWANESWSRRWMGEEKSVLISQNYSEKDDYEHAEWLIEAFKDERYIKIDKRPLFIFYKPFDLPNPQRTIQIFKEVCSSHGIENPYLVASNGHNKDIDPRSLGFDHSLNFETRLSLLWDFNIDKPTLKKFIGNLFQGIWSAKLKVYPYGLYKERAKNFAYNYPGFPCVNVGFDNTARRGKNAIVLKGQNKAEFKKSLEWAKEKALAKDENEQIVFINAWNEWAEGNQLEPSRKFGYAFLEAVKEVFS